MTDETTHIATAAASLDDPYAALSQHLHGAGEIDRERVKRLLYENTSLTSEQAEQVMGCLPPASTLMALASTQLDAQVRREALEEAFSVIAYYPRAAPSEDEWTRYDEQIKHSQAIIRSLIDATPAANACGTHAERLRLRLPTPETMAWAVVGEDGKSHPSLVMFNKNEAERLCSKAQKERVVRVAIRVVEGGDDA